MTRQEFIDQIQTLDQLTDFAYEFDYVFDDVYSEAAYDDEINDDVSDYDGSWREIKSWLESLPDGYDFYVRDCWGDWEGRNDDEIDDLKEEFLDWADSEGDVFDEEEEDDDEEYDKEDLSDSEPEAEEPEPEPDLTLDDILSILWDGAQETA